MKTMIELDDAKAKALAEFLETPVENLTNGQLENYLVLTDGEADEKAREYILDSVWAFNKSFLDCHSEAIAEIPDKDFVDLQGRLCESFNKAVIAMIDDVDHFVDDAIGADGRGHFLSGYDGEENEIEIDGEYYFIYRQN